MYVTDKIIECGNLSVPIFNGNSFNIVTTLSVIVETITKRYKILESKMIPGNIETVIYGIHSSMNIYKHTTFTINVKVNNVGLFTKLPFDNAVDGSINAKRRKPAIKRFKANNIFAITSIFSPSYLKNIRLNLNSNTI
ncbi:MAG: hypothetical protein AAB334_01260 [Patescibacteria group bacterium]